MRAVTKKDQKQVKIFVGQRRASRRNYVYDFSASIKLPSLKDTFRQGGAIDLKEKRAEKKAVFEAVERYSGSRIIKTVKGSVASLASKEIINPKDLIQFSEEQYLKKNFSYQKISDNKKIEWISGYSFLRRKKVLVPAFAVILGHNLHQPKRNWYFPQSSCGLAVEKSYRKAVRNGLLELIERDAAMKAWLLKKPLPKIDLSGIKNSQLKFLINKLSDENLKVDICISSILSIPSVIAILHSNKTVAPFVSFGLAAGPEIENAALKALLEAIMVRNTLEELKIVGKLKRIKKFSSIKEFMDHVIYYANPLNKNKWSFLLSGSKHSLNEIKKMFDFNSGNKYTINHLLGIFRSNKSEIIAVNLTNEVSKSLGLFATRVIVPDLLQMDYNYSARYLKIPGAHKNYVLNPYPHPYG